MRTRKKFVPSSILSDSDNCVVAQFCVLTAGISYFSCIEDVYDQTN
ncbi:MAG: hypothetical protein LBK06_10395 [Planctomycetaceae bacterium]|nr:hypothetical protein [Planctomycetaceae bacterium]